MASLGNLSPYIAGTVASLIALLFLRHRAAHRTRPVPPGPRPLPLIGNLLDIPKEKVWLAYQKWNAQYGDIVYIEALGQKIVILGSVAAVSDLMEQRGTVYSDRPQTSMMDLMAFHWSFASLPYGDLWRRKRKLMHSHFHQGAAVRYRPIQIAIARRFALDILSSKTEKEALTQAVRLNFAQMIIRIVYGIDVDNYESEYISLPEKVLKNASEAFTPGRFFVDFLPVLRHIPAWFPGAGFKRLALDNQVVQRRALENPMNAGKSQMAAGTAPGSVVQTLLEEDVMTQQSRFDLIKDVAGLAYIAGSDTTVAAVTSFFLAMLVYPEVQAKAQAEVDRVVGTERLSELEDEKGLPYVQGVVNECLRWLPVGPTGVPHQTARDDEYRGYFLPKGTIVVGSVWGILHNPEDYPEPERFHPERYLRLDGSLNPDVRNPRAACFGFGRRICPGRYIADTSLFMTVVTLLQTVDVVRAKDMEGNEIIPNVDVSGGAFSHPKPFPWAVRPRGKYTEELLAGSSA